VSSQILQGTLNLRIQRLHTICIVRGHTCSICVAINWCSGKQNSFATLDILSHYSITALYPKCALSSSVLPSASKIGSSFTRLSPVNKLDLPEIYQPAPAVIPTFVSCTCIDSNWPKNSRLYKHGPYSGHGG